jgi:hypothetical protein
MVLAYMRIRIAQKGHEKRHPFTPGKKSPFSGRKGSGKNFLCTLFLFPGKIT